MYQLIKKDYGKVDIPAHFKVYNISNEKIEGLQDLKLLQLPKLHLLKYEKKQITKEELEEQYFRGLESRGQHLISVDYNSAIMVCNCSSYAHKNSCAMKYLKKYMKLKNHSIEKYQ